MTFTWQRSRIRTTAQVVLDGDTAATPCTLACSGKASDRVVVVRRGTSACAIAKVGGDGVVYDDFDITINYSAGTVGTRGMLGNATVTKTGFTQIAATASYVSSSANINPHVWLEDTHVYVAAYRASTSAVTDGKVTARVVYVRS